MDANRLFEAAANAVADNRIAYLFGDRETDARCIGCATVQNFHEEKPPATFFTTPDGQKLSSLAKPQRRRKFSLAGSRQCLVSRLGRKTLAATVATGSNDGAAALGCHTRTEAVPTLTNEFGWLIGTLHLF
jgi:hypothetical protein